MNLKLGLDIGQTPNASPVNYFPSGALDVFKAALALSGTNSVPVLVAGDSISQGSSSADWFTDAWVPLVKDSLQGTYGGSSDGYRHAGYSNTAISGLQSPNLVWVETGVWTRSFTGAGAVALYSLTAADKLTGTVSGDRIDIVFKAPSPAQGTVVNIDIGGVDKGNHAFTEATNSQVILSFTGLTDTAHTVEITNISGTFLIFNGAVGYSGSTGVDIINASQSGIASGNYTGPDITVLPQTLDPFGQKLTFIALGTNDASASLDPVVYQANIQTIADRAITNGSDVMLISFCQSGTNNENYFKYVAAVRQVAVNISSIHLNIWARHFYNDGDARLASGFYPSNINIHPTNLGHQDISDAIISVFDGYGI